MKAIDILMQEHRAIERALDVLEIAAKKLEEGETISAGLIGDTMQFIRLFADRCHHGKEEGLLFPALERSGLPKESGPLAVMQTDHDEGRTFVRSMGEALREIDGGNAGAIPRFCRDARDFSSLLRAHIMKEDHVLFVMADMRLPDVEKDKLTEDFMAAEASGEACRPKAELLRSLERIERDMVNENSVVRS